MVAAALPNYIEHWIETLDRLGMSQAVVDVEEDQARFQTYVRRTKESSLGDPETWFGPPL